MKIFKRILVIATLVVIALLISYLIFTKNNVASKNHTFSEADTICGNFRLSSVNARNYELFALKDCGQSGRAAGNHEISQAQNSREICESIREGNINA